MKRVLMRSGYAEMLADGAETELWIYGDIGASWYDEESVTAKAVAETLATITGGTLTVRVNSYGGVVSDGIAIFNAIRRCGAGTIRVEIDGVAMSAASLIAMAADPGECRIAANALLMIHAPWGYASGNAQDMRDHADMLDRYARAMASSYARGTVTEADALALLTDGKDHHYTATEAVAAGFCDAVSFEALPIAASANADHLRAAALARYLTPQTPTAGAKPAGEPSMTVKTVPPADTQTAPTDAEIQARAQALVTAHHANLDSAFSPLMNGASPHAELIRAEVSAARGNLQDTPDVVRARILAKLGEQTMQPLGGASHTRIESGMDQRDKLRVGIGAAVLARMGTGAVDRANPYRGMALHQIAATCLEAVGVRTDGMTRSEIAARVLAAGHTTSDFPYLMLDAANKRLQAAYEAWPTTWASVAAVSAVSDFKPVNLIRIGAFTSLETVAEGAEYQQGTIGEEKETAQAITKGKFIQLTRQMIINDDLAGFARLSQVMGQAAARTVNADVWGVLNANPTMSDSVALFHATHGNLAGSNGAMSVATISAARAAMRVQKAPNAAANEYLNIMPRYLVCPVVKEDLARQIVTSTENIDTAGSRARNPIRDWGPLEVISDPVLDGSSTTAWYLLADPNMVPVLEVVFLDGNQVPYLEQEMEFLTDAVRSKVRLDYGVAANDYRGGYKNAGA